MVPTGFVPYFGAIPELVTIGVRVPRFRVFKIDAENTKLSQTVKLFRLADSVMIRVNPDPEPAIHAISGIDYPVAVTAVLRIVKNGQGTLPIAVLGWWLNCHIAE